MSAVTTVFITSVVLFTALSFLIETERRRGSRVALTKVRDWLDEMIERFFTWLREAWEHFIQYVVKLGLYYSLHSLLRTLLQALVAAYDYLEKHFETNRFRARALQAEKKAKGTNGHLNEVAKHKAEVALSPEEEDRLREEKLEERD